MHTLGTNQGNILLGGDRNMIKMQDKKCWLVVFSVKLLLQESYLFENIPVTDIYNRFIKILES